MIRFLCQTSARSGGSILANQQQQLNKLTKRWSGHNAMEIEPSNFAWKKFKDLFHFYTILGLVPITVLGTIIGIRANPELREIPEGYEPRHWEYYKHPITRWIARYVFAAPDLCNECAISLHEQHSETLILRKIEKDVNTVMSFYNDHRSKFFIPYYAESHRQGRDFLPYAYNSLTSNEGHYIDLAYEPSTPVPVEGYKPDYPYGGSSHGTSEV